MRKGLNCGVCEKYCSLLTLELGDLRFAKDGLLIRVPLVTETVFTNISTRVLAFVQHTSDMCGEAALLKCGRIGCESPKLK